MKKINQKEPTLARLINAKKAKRKSYKKETKLKNRAIRRFLKNNFEIGKEIYKIRFDYEY